MTLNYSPGGPFYSNMLCLLALLLPASCLIDAKDEDVLCNAHFWMTENKILCFLAQFPK